MSPRVVSVIMGGGRGSRLWPLTRDRCKPAVPLAGKYRLVDIPISNCLNSGLNQIYLLTQFNTASLHRHIREAYRFDRFGGGFVELLAAEQTEVHDEWYQGTADAVRQNLVHLALQDEDTVLILSGDQLYRMDYRTILDAHARTQARVTVAATPIPAADASRFGLMRVGDQLEVQEFVEKPKDPQVIDSLLVPSAVSGRPEDQGPHCLGSMGIYVFSGSVLKKALKSQATDFGREIIPGQLPEGGLFSYVFSNYWEDIGTVRAFFEANLKLTEPVPPFNFFDGEHPIYSRARYLPASKINQADIEATFMADGAIVDRATLRKTVIGLRSHIRAGAELHRVLTLGAEYYETDDQLELNRAAGIPHLGIGRDCYIEDAILDVNARIGDGVHLSPEGKPDGFQEGDVFVRDGILVVVKNGRIPSGTVI